MEIWVGGGGVMVQEVWKKGAGVNLLPSVGGVDFF